MSGVRRAEIVLFTSEYGVPLRAPELHVHGASGEDDVVVELPQVTTVVARVAPSDVSHVDVTFIATLRYEIVEDGG